jgi:hypothetical protein
MYQVEEAGTMSEIKGPAIALINKMQFPVYEYAIIHQTIDGIISFETIDCEKIKYTYDDFINNISNVIITQ